MHTVHPVSYTHLDVYKRQQLENKSREIDKLDRNKDKVSSSGNYDKINKNMVIGDNSVDVGSNSEILMRIEVNGEVTVVDESESGGKESLSEYSEQRANFSSDIVGVKTPKLLFEEEGSSMWETCGLQMIP